jgi:outer membrane protein TolC
MDVMRDREIATLRKRNESGLEQEYAAAKERKEIGDITQTDVYQAASRLAQARSLRIDAYSNLKSSEAVLEEETGNKAPSLMTPPDNMQFYFPETLAALNQMAQTQNPQIWIAKFEHKAAQYNEKASFADLLPQLSAFASYNKQYDPQPGIIPQSTTQIIGLRASLSL